MTELTEQAIHLDFCEAEEHKGVEMRNIGASKE